MMTDNIENGSTDMGALPIGAGQEGDMALLRSMGAIGQPIGKKEISEAWQTLLKYRQGKANLENKIVDNWQWYKLRQWECMRKGEKSNQIEPASGWLFNAIRNKHADAMDNFPSINIQPHEANDKEEAKILSSIIPVLLNQCQFKKTYNRVMEDKLISGTGVYGVFWDSKKHNGLGDVAIEEIDLINMFWESGITDIQNSRNLFYVSLRDNDLLEAEYPQLENKLGNPVMDITKYIYDDTIDTNSKSLVVDWYYKKFDGGNTVLHFCKFVAGQDEPLFATENEAEYTQTGLYEHGKYPFVFDPMFNLKGTPCGFGMVDIGKGTQEYIDRGDQAIMQNMLFNAKPRHFIRNDGSINETEYSDLTKDFVHVDGNLGQDSILPVNVNSLNDIYVTILINKIDELKEITGNRDVSTGGTTGGATAASAIAAMQEAGSKLSRDMNQGSYNAFEQVCKLIIELIRQFYDTVRQFRIVGENGQSEFVDYTNAGIKPQPQGASLMGVPQEMGVDVGYRVPEFDIDVTAEKASPYSKVSQNELALQLYSAGFFHPQNAEPALACISMMDFDHKDMVAETIQKNSLMYQQFQLLMQNAFVMAQMLDRQNGSNILGQLTSQLGLEQQGQQAPMQGGSAQMPQEAKESSTTAKARQQTADATVPR